MNTLLQQDEVHYYLDRIAVRGCAEVNQMIDTMDSGGVIDEISHLPENQQQQVFRELKQIMQVYDSCEVSTS